MRGMDSVKWAIFHGYNPGATLHFIDAGVDTGPIIDRRLIPIAWDDSFASLRMKCRDACIDMLLDHFEDLHSGRISPKRLPKQDKAKGLESRRMGYFDLQKAKARLEDMKKELVTLESAGQKSGGILRGYE